MVAKKKLLTFKTMIQFDLPKGDPETDWFLEDVKDWGSLEYYLKQKLIYPYLHNKSVPSCFQLRGDLTARLRAVAKQKGMSPNGMLDKIIEQVLTKLEGKKDE